FVAPAAATTGAAFLIYAVFYNQAGAALFYLAFFAVTMAIGLLYYNQRKRKGEVNGDGSSEAGTAAAIEESAKAA
ncbi:MAG: hypothetical protein FWD93_05770, partial [Coriobacteriia bacterium]|nr:hypothetical protein [Coriobacteriia bacterium]